MEPRPIWTVDALEERATSWDDVRPRVWAIEELSHNAPERLHAIAPELLRDAPAIAEVTSTRLALRITPDEANQLIDGLEATPQNLDLFLRAGSPDGTKLARRFRLWGKWLQLHRDSFIEWFEQAALKSEPELAIALASNLVEQGSEFIAESILELNDVGFADEVGAHLHLATTGMLGAFSPDAGARGVAALRSPHFAMPESIRSAFQEIGTLPPHLPRARFQPLLEAIWEDIRDVVDGLDGPFEMLRSVSLDVVRADGAASSEAAVRLANRALAAGLLRAGVDRAFASADSVEERLDVWLSFASAGFKRADELLLDDLDDEEAAEVVREAIARVPSEALSSAVQLAWGLVSVRDEGAQLGEAIATALEGRLVEGSAYPRAAETEGYRELIAHAPTAFLEVARGGLMHDDRTVHVETIQGLEASGDKAASELLRDKFDELMTFESTPWGARALAVLADPDALGLLVDSWRPGESKLASFVLAMAEICGEPLDEQIVREGEQAFADEAHLQNLEDADMEATLARLRERFFAIIKCDECGRFGTYDVAQIAVDPRSIKSDGIDGNVVPTQPVTCKFCGAEESYQVDDETNYYLVPHLLAGGSSETSRVVRTRLELVDGTKIYTASQALSDAKTLASAGDADAAFDWVRVARVFAEPDALAEIEDEVSTRFPEAYEEWSNRDPDAATWSRVEQAISEAKGEFDRKQKGNWSKATKVGRYGVSQCYVSESPETPVLALAVVRKMPRGKFAVGWVGIDKKSADVAVAKVEYGLSRAQVGQMLSGWNGAPYEKAEVADVAQHLTTWLELCVGRGRTLRPEVISFWPYFKSVAER